MPKTAWLVTHAKTTLKDKEGYWLPDPEMEPLAFGKVAVLRPVLNKLLRGEPEVHCGIGRRQWQVARALGFDIGPKVFFSSIWGDAATLAELDGKKVVLLGHGLIIPYDQYHSAKHAGGSVIAGVISSLPNNSVICSGRSVLVRLGMEPEQCHSGALYALNVRDDGSVIPVLVQQGEILQS